MHDQPIYCGCFCVKHTPHNAASQRETGLHYTIFYLYVLLVYLLLDNFILFSTSQFYSGLWINPFTLKCDLNQSSSVCINLPLYVTEAQVCIPLNENSSSMSKLVLADKYVYVLPNSHMICDHPCLNDFFYNMCKIIHFAQ